MALALGLALVLAIVWTDSCKRHLWESLGPLHHFGCDCRGYRYYCRHDPSGNIFSFSIEPPEDLASAGRGTLDMTIVELAGPKSSFSFVAVQLGDAVQCTRGLSAAPPTGSVGVHQELRLPIPSRMPRNLHIFLYGRNRPWGERLLAFAKVPLDATRLFGLHDITVPFLNYDGEPSGHVRLVMRMGAPGSARLSTVDLIPYMAEASDMSDECCRGCQAGAPGTGEDRPIVVFSAGGKPSIAVPVPLADIEAKGENEEEKEVQVEAVTELEPKEDVGTASEPGEKAEPGLEKADSVSPAQEASAESEEDKGQSAASASSEPKAAGPEEHFEEVSLEASAAQGSLSHAGSEPTRSSVTSGPSVQSATASSSGLAGLFWGERRS